MLEDELLQDLGSHQPTFLNKSRNTEYGSSEKRKSTVFECCVPYHTVGYQNAAKHDLTISDKTEKPGKHGLVSR